MSACHVFRGANLKNVEFDFVVVDANKSININILRDHDFHPLLKKVFAAQPIATQFCSNTHFILFADDVWLCVSLAGEKFFNLHKLNLNFL